MKGTRFRLAVVALLALGAIAGTLFGAPNVTAVPAPNAVVVVNGNDQPVPTSIVGTPTVNVGGPISVEPTREPYQQYVTGNSAGGGESCVALDVPAGKLLTLESLSVDADGPTGVEPVVFIRIDALTPTGTSFVRAVTVDLQPGPSQWSGVADVLLHTGAPAPGGRTFELNVCVQPGSGGSFGSFRGFASGWIEDA